MKPIDSGSQLSFEARAISEQCKGPLAYLCRRKGTVVAAVLGLQENHAAGTGLSFRDHAGNSEPESFTHNSDCDPFSSKYYRNPLLYALIVFTSH